MADWRVGHHYEIHVYQDDIPIATFLTAADAHRAVRDHNRSEAIGLVALLAEVDQEPLEGKYLTEILSILGLPPA